MLHISLSQINLFHSFTVLFIFFLSFERNTARLKLARFVVRSVEFLLYPNPRDTGSSLAS